MCERKTKRFLWNFGVGNTYRGFYYCLYGVKLAAEDPSLLNCVTKTIYPEVARKYKTSVNCVERDIRTVAEVVWKNGGREFFYETTGELSGKRPTNSRFLEMLVKCATSEELTGRARGNISCEDCKIIEDYKAQVERMKKENEDLSEMIQWMHDLIWDLIKKMKGNQDFIS